MSMLIVGNVPFRRRVRVFSRHLRVGIVTALFASTTSACAYFDLGPTVNVQSLHIVIESWPDVLSVGDTAIATIKTVNQDSVTVFMSDTEVEWRLADTHVAGLRGGTTPWKRVVVGFAPGRTSVRIDVRVWCHSLPPTGPAIHGVCFSDSASRELTVIPPE